MAPPSRDSTAPPPSSGALPPDSGALPPDSGALPPSSGALAPDSGAGLPHLPAPASSSGAVSAVAEAAPPSSEAALGRIEAALHRFLASRKDKEGRDFIEGVIVERLAGKGAKKEEVDHDLLDDLTQLAWVRAREGESLPWTEWGVKPWVRRVTKRAIAEYFRGGEDDRENLVKGVSVEETSDSHAEKTDYGAREHLIAKWLEGQCEGDAVAKRDFALMMEHEVVGRSLAELAVAHDTTEQALANRFYRLRKRLIPRVALMDEEKPRKFAIFGGIFAFFGGLVAVVIYVVWLHYFAPPPPPPPLPELPAPSASAAPGPEFDNALPTQPAPSAEPPDAGAKPLPDKPPR